MNTRRPLLLALTLCTPLLLTAAPSEAAPVENERVVMNLGDFLDLWEKTRKKDDEVIAPRAFAIPSARYKGEVLMDGKDPRSALFTATIRVETLRAKEWARVPLLPASVALQSASIGGKEAPVVIEGGFYTLVTDRRGAFDVKLEFGASVHSAEGWSNVEFQLAPSGATEVELTVPADDDLDFTVDNAHLQSEKVSGRSKSVKATLPSTGSLSIRWQRELPEEEAAEKAKAQVYAEVSTLVGISDGLMRASSTINHTILFAGKDRLQVMIPEGMTVVDVQGAGIRDWKKGKDGKLDVELNFAAEGSYPLTVITEKVVGEDDGSVVAPVPVPLEVKRLKGWMGVESRGNLEISAGAVEEATAVDVRSLPGSILGITSQPVLLGYKYLGPDAKIPLEVSHHEDVDVLVTLLDQLQARTMWTREGRRLTSVSYQVRNNRKQFLRVALPEGSELWSASVGGRAVQPAEDDEGRVMIPLIRSQAAGGALAAFDVEVVYVENGEAAPDNGRGTFKARLPTADAPTTYVAWTVYVPDKAKAIRRSFDGSLQHVDWLSNPIPEEDMAYIETATPQVQQNAVAQAEHGGMGEGAVPVPVSLPLQGNPIYFEKLIALDEELTVEFDYRGLKK